MARRREGRSALGRVLSILVFIIIGVILFSIIASNSGYDSTEINEIGLIYEGGVVQDKVYKGLLEPGSTNNRVGLGSTVYRYRIDQRSWIAKAGDTTDTVPVMIVSEDDVRLSVEYQLYFKLNLNEETLRKFHENLGVKTGAWTNSGWIEMLQTYFDPQVERALEAAGLKFKWRELYGSEEARIAFQNDTVANLKRNIFEVIGDDYFCGPSYTGPGSECGDFTFTVGKPTPTNSEIVEAVEREQTARAETVAQQQENERIRAQLEVERELVELYGAQGALLRDAIQSGQVQIMVVPQGSDVTVPTPPGGQPAAPTDEPTE